MKLTLHATTYDWVFLPIAGSTFTDSGTGSVHAAPQAPATSTPCPARSARAVGPLAGAEVLRVRRGHGAYVEQAVSVAGGGYCSTSPAGGSYKLFIQPHETGFPDQWHGGADFAAATTILLDANKTVNLSLAGRHHPARTPCRARSARAVARWPGPRCYRVRRGQRRLRQERP